MSGLSSSQGFGQHSSPITSPTLPPFHPQGGQSLLPPSIPLSTGESAASSTASSVLSSSSHSVSYSLPPLHPPASSAAAQSSYAQHASPTSSFSPSPPTFTAQHHIPSCSLALDATLQDANPAFMSTFSIPNFPSNAPPSIYSLIHPSSHLTFMVMMRRILTQKTRTVAKEVACQLSPLRTQRMWVMMSAVTMDDRLLTFYCCFLPKPRREDREDDERERAELRVELEGRAQLHAAQVELQEEMTRIERTYQQQLATLQQQQHKYGISQTMIDHYSQHPTSGSSSSSSAPSTPRDPALLSLSGLPRPQQLQLHALYARNVELKTMQAQHTAKLSQFMQLLARVAPFPILSGDPFAPPPIAEGSRAHTAPSLVTGWEAGSEEEADVKMSLMSPSTTGSVGVERRGFSMSVATTAATTGETPSPMSGPGFRATSAALSSTSSSSASSSSPYLL